MSGFSIEWLALREGYDRRARNPEVLAAAISSLRSKSTVRLVDLACGTGSTLRSLGPHLTARQFWDLVDNDPRLLDAARQANASNDANLNAVRLDLNRDIEAALDRPGDLVTMSALLDLVSEDWLNRFARHAAARAVPLYAALTYDGRIELSPSNPMDPAVTAAVNAHQLTDKGFGPALGPSGATAAISRFEALGYSVLRGHSDWVIGTADQAIQIELLNGWAAAAREMQSLPTQDINDWLARRRAAVDRQSSTMRVGHVDFFAVPSAMR
jgi:SAM-dependent methyltransferase